MPEIMRLRGVEKRREDRPVVVVDDRIRGTRDALTLLLREAADARRQRAEVAPERDGGAVCAWNHFENIPTFYNWNNRPR